MKIMMVLVLAANDADSGVSGNDFWAFGNGNGLFHSRNLGTGREWKKHIPKIREREGNEKKAFPKFGNGKGMKKYIPTFRERKSEAIIPRNTRKGERKWKRKQINMMKKKDT